MELSENLVIRPLNNEEVIPYELLLLADPSRELIDSYLPASSIYVAEANGEIIGEYVLCPLDKKAAEVRNIAVSPRLQGKGIGRELLIHATHTARHKGFRSLTIGTANSSVGQIYLYQQQGFEITGVRIDHFLKNYAHPVYENGEQCRDQLVLTKQL